VTDIIYHLVPNEYWEAQLLDRFYVPADFAREGFIHCTRGDEQIAIVANRYYRNDRRGWHVLVIDEKAVSSEIKYEPGADGMLYPHVYGPLNREAVIEVLPMPRDPGGVFQPLKRS
jgi:uncharacterized protein (DUF952 family)